MGLFDKLKEGLRKTKESMMKKVEGVIHSFTKIDEDFLEELEETLIMSDVGMQTAEGIIAALRKKIKETGATDTGAVTGLLREIIAEMLAEERPLSLATQPSIVFVIGVNGAGKTTTIGKLAARYKAEGKKVLLGAADTFRAAAIDQLAVWAERSGVDMVRHQEGSDPAAVVYDSIEAAKARGTDILLIDTAGRLHNKKNLMAELHKMFRIVSQKAEGCDVEVLLVLDATTGQNAVSQAELFKEAADITGIVLTKLDGTAKGGIVIALKNQLGLPVRFVGVGEKIDDLQPFQPEDFVRALFE
ncbi:MAG: signal recognition particle-docking protein FtsY [Oscillospiraceae bacterium]|jgi:fused signal recognition particle receptor|nr:signal recognition particle-docking protein FtsY [Oscillospiraceae bacterium]